MNVFEKVSLFAAVCLVFCGAAFAVPAYPGIMQSKQPDGSIVHIRVVGNEHLHYTVSEEGNLIVRDSLGFWNYSDKAGKPTGVKVHRKDDRSESEIQFLKKRDSKKILEEFLKEKKRKNRKMNSESDSTRQSSLGEDGAASRGSFRAAATVPLADVTSIATCPKYNVALTQGEIRGLVILVQFSDVKFKSSTPQEDYERYMNEEGYNENGMRWSVRDYFVSNSMGVFKPYFDVAAPVTLSNSQKYYGSLDYPDEAFIEAIRLIANRGDIDFSNYDNNNDGRVDFVYMIYAGIGAADTGLEGEVIWPQASSDVVRVSNVRIARWACSNEISGTAYLNNPNTRVLAGIGLIVHEFSHVLGLPDFYDVIDQNNMKTPYVWSLMDVGEYNYYSEITSLPGTAPPRLSAFERYSVGWLTPRVLEKVNADITISGIDQNDAVLVSTSDPNEYFLLDYRAKYDSITPMPQSGMLIWRVRYDRESWNMNKVNIEDDIRFDLIRADGSPTYNMNFDMFTDASLRGDPFPGRKKVNEFNGFVTYAGDSLGLYISDITETDSAVHFHVKWAGVEDVSSSSVEPESSSSKPVLESSSSEPASSSSAPVPESSSSGELVKAFAVAPAPQVHMTLDGRTLRVVAGLEGEKELRLFDLQGHQLHSERFTGSSATFLLERFGHGAFIVRLTSGNRILAVKRL